MRKAKRNVRKTTDTRGMQGYHHSDGVSRNYAQAGYGDKRYYYASDRKVELERINGEWVRKDGKPIKGYGLEIELANNAIVSTSIATNVLRTMVLNHIDEDLFKIQSDGSLRGSSTAEAITQVISKEAVRNYYPKWKRMYDENMPETGWQTNSSCGMHVNISLAVFGKEAKAQFDAIKKLCYFVNNRFSFSCWLFHRSIGSTDYCAPRETFGNLAYMKGLSMAEARSFVSSHGVSFNWGHYGESPSTARVELRLVGPQDSYIRFRNTMECVFHLVEACKSLSWASMDDPKAVFKGCNKYVVQRLGDLVRAGLLTQADFDAIKESADMTTNFEVSVN